MQLRIEHELYYEYSEAVYLEPHYLYLQPKPSCLLTLVNYEIAFDPKPHLVSTNHDISDNTQQIIFFNNTAKYLSIKATSIVETLEFNPLSFVYHPFENSTLPIKYRADVHQMLSPYLMDADVTTLIDQTARQIAANAGWNTTAFLTALNQFINSFEYEIREEGLPNVPEITLLHRRGSCRDYSVLFMAMCKVVGIAARFVSGFLYGDPLQAQYLHAWVEVYLPGGGWRGFDPTQNCLVSGKHIALASSAIPQLVTPIYGTFRGKASSTFNAHVSIRQLEEAPFSQMVQSF